MQTIVVQFEGHSYELELYTTVIGNKNVYTVLVDDPALVPVTGRVISYLSEVDANVHHSVFFSSEKTPFKGRLKEAIAHAIDEQVKLKSLDTLKKKHS